MSRHIRLRERSSGTRDTVVKTVLLSVFALLFAAAAQTEAGQAYFYMGSMCADPSELDGNETEEIVHHDN